jgi:hypothetical protein
MEVAINFLRDGAADTVNRFKIGQSRSGNASCGAEMHEQGLLSLGSDSGDLIEWRGRYCLRAPGTMAADSEAMRFIAKTL